MNKSFLTLLLTVLVALIVLPGFAQTVDYTFSATNETYTAITDGVALGTETTDDQRFVDPATPEGGTITTGVGFPIGFNFNFNGAVFDRLAINANGWISLGQSALTPSVNNASSSAYTPLSSTTVIAPDVLVNRISAFARDLQAQAGASIKLQTIGTAPNRICVVQWENYKKYGANGTGDNLDFQIQLHETTNNVKIVYGAIVANTTAGNMQVGLRGPLATDFNARQGDASWNNTTPATANNQYVILNDVNYPANGLTFNFNFPVASQPPNPANIASPADAATLVSPFTTLNWSSGGGMPTGYRLFLGTNNPPTNVVNNMDMGMATTYTPNPELNPSTTYYWQVVPYNGFGNAANCPVWSFTTHGDASVSSLPYSQNWDAVTAPALPFDWTAIVNSTSTTAYVRTSITSPNTTPNCVQIANSADAAANLLLVGPQVATNINVNSIRVKFWGKGGANYLLQVGVMTNPTDHTTFQMVQEVPVIANWNEYAVSLAGYTGAGRFIAFRHGLGATYRTLYVDGVIFEEIAPNDLAATAITGNATPSVGSATNYTVNVYNNGTASQSTYTVKLYNEAGTELASVAGPTITAGATQAVVLPWTPTTAGAVSIYGKVMLAGDINPANDQTPNLSLTVQPEGVMSVTVGTGELAEGVPYEFFYKNSIFETLYYPAELGMFGNISAISFYNNFLTDLPNKPIKLWLGTTQLEDLSAGWILPDQLTLVYDGTMNFPVGQNTITIPLQVPFSYSGGNLVLYANRPMDTSYFSSSDNFQAQTVGTTRARKLVSDSVEYDPTAPSAAGTLSGTFPKTTFIMTPLSPDPLFVVNPASKNFGSVVLGTSPSQTFTIANAGGGTLNITNISIAGSPMFTLGTLPTLPANLNTGQTLNFSAIYAPTAAGEHTATITITSAIGTHTVALTGTGFDTNIYTMPYVQNFDEVTVPALPLGWSSLYQATVTTGYVKTVTTSPQSTPNCVAMYNPTDINTIAMLISPPVAPANPINSIRVKFWGKGTNYAVKVGVMTNPLDAATFTEIQTVTLTAAWAQYAVPLSSYTGAGTFIAIKHACLAAGQTIYLDTVEFELMGANDLAALSVTGNSTPSVNAATNYTVNVFNNGTAPQSTYTVKLYDANHVELASVAGTTVAAGATEAVVVPWTPTVEGAMSIYGKVILTGDINPGNDASPLLPISVQPAGIISVTIGTGDQTARMPLDFYFKNSLNQTLYYPAEIGMVGNITTMSLYNQFTTATLQNMPVKIWMGTTQLADLSADWIPSSQLTLVFDGTMNFPAGQNTITFPLQAPFAYTGGNLVVLFNRPMDTQYYSSLDYFKCQTIGTNRARNVYNDTTTLDPAAPTGGTVTGQFPMTSFTMTPMTGDPVFMVTPASHNFGDVNLGGSRNQSFNVMNIGGGNLVINNITISGSPTMALNNLPTLPATLATGAQASFTVTYTPTSLGASNATITITDNLGTRYTIGARNDQRSTNRTAHTVEVTGNAVNDITIGDGSQNALWPLNFYYKNSLFETIYTADEMSNFIGMITGIKFYNQFTTDLQTMPTKIWLGSTTLNDLSADWIPSTALTLVYDGTVNYPSGQNVISIDFPVPYMHLDGGNLVMMVNRPMDTQYYSSSDYFKCQTIGTNRARRINSDSTEYDPAAPTGGTVTGQFPKTTFVVIPGGVGDIQGTVLGAGNAPLEGVQVTVDSRPYSTTTNAQGQFFIANVLPGNYTITFSKYGYVNQSQNFVLEEDETETINITLAEMAMVNVTGTILASDTGAGIGGANIHLAGYADYNGSSIGNGTFAINSVYANNSYAYVISAAGYVSATGTITVGATNHNMGNITLSEIAYAPNSVEAEVNATYSAVNLSWNAPDPNAVEITEGFEATTFPPAGWSQDITNTGPANTVGVLPTWCSFGSITITGSGTVNPTEGSMQAGMWWDYNHQDEWLKTQSFNCPPDAYMSFDTYLHMGSTNGDHYYVKVSSNGGNTWDVLWDGSAQAESDNFYNFPVTVSLASYGGLQIQLAFHAEDPETNDGVWYVWFIDNVYIGNMIDTVRFDASTLIPASMTKKDLSITNTITPNTLSRETGRSSQTTFSGISTPIRSSNRALVGYNVWRLPAGQEGNEPAWTSLTPNTVTALTLEDPAFATLANGSYKWAVKAVYTAGVSSAPAFSNVIVKDVANGTIVGFVRRSNNQGIAGATVSAGTYTTTTNNAGAYSLLLPAGLYNVTATANGFNSQTIENITVIPNQNTTVNFVMTLVSNEDEVIPVSNTALVGNFPNPFNPETTISYQLKDAAPVRLDIYNLKGQLVRTLVNEDQASGRYRLRFDSLDANGNKLASGLYLYRLSAGSYTSTKKMMLMQ